MLIFELFLKQNLNAIVETSYTLIEVSIVKIPNTSHVFVVNILHFPLLPGNRFLDSNRGGKNEQKI